MTPLRPLLMEAFRELRANLTMALVAVALTAAVVVVVSLSYGRAVTAAQDAVRIMDSTAARTITVRFDDAAETPVSKLQAFGRLSSVDTLLLLGPIRNASNHITGDPRIGIRDCHPGSDIRICPEDTALPQAFASREVLKKLGFTGDTGVLSDGNMSYVLRADDAPLLSVGGQFAHQAIGVVPTAGAADARDLTVSQAVLVASSRTAVPTLLGVVSSTLSGVDPTHYTVEHRLDLVEAGRLVDSTLLQSSRAQAVLVLGIAGIMLALAEYSAARTRRRFAGLRRALGARRWQIVILAMTTSALSGVLGVLLGAACSLSISFATGASVPPPAFLTALAVITLAVAALAAVVPAVYSSTRQPARELRMP
ncbi:ABC transporter permease [Microbacterium marinilacus]|uniref:ABC3 transporter permease C-terminal domain-containing protein n=1 Tax=Microbacterium marinilacus TaxID=415209 RepID=A0ABP7BYJ3_9MICO|nr:ABC transporter permease [Microbacterium marinilacus]MBY0688094.1 ABC transporter permease [Microbacterium marinilacus]